MFCIFNRGIGGLTFFFLGSERSIYRTATFKGPWGIWALSTLITTTVGSRCCCHSLCLTCNREPPMEVARDLLPFFSASGQGKVRLCVPVALWGNTGEFIYR